jgi:hypothetical protein
MRLQLDDPDGSAMAGSLAQDGEHARPQELTSRVFFDSH